MRKILLLFVFIFCSIMCLSCSKKTDLIILPAPIEGQSATNTTAEFNNLFTAYDEKLTAFIKNYNIEVNGYDVLEGELDIKSTEGNRFIAQYKDAQLKYYEIEIYGETGKRCYELYRFEGLEYFRDVLTNYNVPFYLEDFDSDKSTIQTTEYINDNGVLYILNRNDKQLILAQTLEQKDTYNHGQELAKEIDAYFKNADKSNYILTNKTVVNWQEFQSSKFPLIAAIPEKDIYLYGIKNNNRYGIETVLYVGDTGHYYEIPYGTPRWILPEMQLSDFDGEGIEELAVINYYGSGTGVSIMGLQIIRINEKTEYGLPWSIYSFAPNDYLKQVEKAVSYKIKDRTNNIFELAVGSEKHLLDLNDTIWEDGDNITDILCSGDIVHFIFKDNKIQAQFEIGAIHKKYATPDFFGTVYADCIFENNKFTLKNFSFLTDTEKRIQKIEKAVQNQKELFCNGKIINVEQYDPSSDIFILQMNDGFWFDKVYLVKYADGKIAESRLLTDECVTKAKFVPLGGFKEFFVELYYSTHMGNGGLKLFSLDPDIPDFDIYGVYDGNTEGADYADLQKLFPANEFSFVYKNGYLDVKYAQPYNNEPNTIAFSGIQQLLDENDNILDESECKVAYSYNSESKTMVLDKSNCIFPKYWFYNWNAIGKGN